MRSTDASASSDQDRQDRMQRMRFSFACLPFYAGGKMIE